VVVVGSPGAGKVTFVKQLLEPQAWRRTGYAEGGRQWSASRPVWEGGVSVWYNVYLRNNKLQFQSTDTPIIR
jgi:GTPase SAR1 family protein